MPEPKHAAPRRRRWTRCVLGAVGGLLALLLVYPVWMPWLLRPLAAPFGIQFGKCTRHGYAAFEFSNVRWTDGSASVFVERLRLQTPHRWLWSRLRGSTGPDPQVRGDGWRVEVRQGDPAGDGGLRSAAELLDLIQRDWPTAGAWIQSMLWTEGTLDLGQPPIAVPSLTWRTGLLSAEAFESRLALDLTSMAATGAELSISNGLVVATLELRRDQAQWTFEGAGVCRSNRLQVSGSFDRSQWLPAAAVLTADALHIAPIVPELGAVAELEGRGRALWTNGAYHFDINLENPPAAAPADRDRLRISARGHGDLAAVHLEHLELSSPFLKATLHDALTINFAGRIEGWHTTLDLWADLAGIRGIPAEGELCGHITVLPAFRSPVRAGFKLEGTRVHAAGLEARAIELAGRLHWPTLQVTNLTAALESGGTFTAKLEMDLNRREVLESDWAFDRSGPGPLGSLQLDTVHADGSAQGVWPELNHTGTVAVAGLALGAFHAGTARAHWTGAGLEIQRLEARLESGASTVRFSGKGGVQWDNTPLDAQIECMALELQTPEGKWTLKEPVPVHLRRRDDSLELNCPPVQLARTGASLLAHASLRWPSSGSLQLDVQGLRAEDLDDFLTQSLPRFSVSNLAAAFAWDNGPLTFELRTLAGWTTDDGSVWTLNGDASADGDALRFESVRLRSNGSDAAELAGDVPLRIEPGRGWAVTQSPKSGPAHLDLRVSEGGPLWRILETYAGVQVESPSLTLEAHGAVPDLKGRLTFGAAHLSLTRTNAGRAFVIPPLDHPELEAAVDGSGIEIRRASALLLGQRVEANARWAFTATDWKERMQSLLAPDWKQLSGSLRLEHADLSALSSLAPGLVAPIGRMGLEVELKPGLQVQGHLTLTNAATRYLKPVGALRDINADLTLQGREARVTRFEAMLGGRPTVVSGSLGWRSDGERRLDLHLTGANLSLVRDPDLFLRADLDLHLSKSFGEVARLTGEVGLQRSLLFRDFNALIGFDREQPQQRPPYFSIPQPPFGDWQLDVRVKGDRFLNVFSPAFKGEVSAGLQLTGTLREPIAVGTVTVDHGKILFPFGTVDVENGRVDLTREDPYRPLLNFRAEGQNFGYTITVDLSGPADAPNLAFQSVPPLTAQQILLMLSAGEIPRSDFGYTTTDKASRVGLYIGKEFVNRFIGNTSTSERLILRSGQDITDEGKPTYSLEYRFTDRWSLFGEYNRFQDFNSGLKFKVLSK